MQKLFMINITEIKLLRLISIARGTAKGKTYNSVLFEPIVSSGLGSSKEWYEKLLEQEYLPDRIARAQGKLDSPCRTYKQVLQEKDVGIDLDWHITTRFPAFAKTTLNIEKQNGEQVSGFVPTVPIEGEASGSHGEWGFKFLLKFLLGGPERPTVRAFYNGDNVNAMPDKYMVGWMIEENIPFALLATPRTLNDAKGGMFGRSGKPGNFVPKLIELATAIVNGQEKLFQKIGIDVDPEGYFTGIVKYVKGTLERRKQLFNTNIVLMNEQLVSDILYELFQTLYNEVFHNVSQKERDEYVRQFMHQIISPDLILKGNIEKDEKFTIEGPIGTCLVNLNNFFMTLHDNRNSQIRQNSEKIKEILEKRGIERLLHIVPVGRTFFSPVKLAIDHWIQAHSDYYRLNIKSWINNEVVTSDRAIQLAPEVMALGPKAIAGDEKAVKSIKAKLREFLECIRRAVDEKDVNQDLVNVIRGMDVLKEGLADDQSILDIFNKIEGVSGHVKKVKEDSLKRKAVLPFTPFAGPDAKDKYYKDIWNMLRTLGTNAIITRLHTLDLQGDHVMLPDSELIGDVGIYNITGEELDLRELDWFKDHAWDTESRRLVLDRKYILYFDREGRFCVHSAHLKDEEIKKFIAEHRVPAGSADINRKVPIDQTPAFDSNGFKNQQNHDQSILVAA